MSEFPASLRLTDGRPMVWYRDEASLRDGLARLAYLAGWHVETEHHIVGWGRPDLYLQGPDGSATAVEIKLDLTRSAAIRKAFQQADVYAKALGPHVDVVLVAPQVDRALAQQYDLAYADVWFLDVNQFCRWLYGARCGFRERHLLALARQRALAEQLDISTAVLRRASDFSGSPLGFIPDHTLPTTPVQESQPS
jgi:hypothetical protein